MKPMPTPTNTAALGKSKQRKLTSFRPGGQKKSIGKKRQQVRP